MWMIPDAARGPLADLLFVVMLFVLFKIYEISNR